MEAPSDEEIIAGLADGMPVGVWVARAPGGEFVFANAPFKQLMGLDARSDVARGEYAEPYRIHDRSGDLYPEEKMPFVRALVAREAVMVDDIVIHRPDGHRMNVRAKARPVFHGDEISHVVIVFFDITGEVEALAAQREAERRLHRSQRMESIGTLARGVAHDFNNLVCAIRIIAGDLRASEADEDRRESLQTLLQATETASDLSQSLLAFAARDGDLSRRLDVSQIVRNLQGILKHAVHARIEHRSELRAERRVMGDPSRLEQVVMNLVINAGEAMPEGGTICIRTYDEGACTVLEVEDDGPGVPYAIRDRVFEPYVSSKENAPSSGLGLATVYGIVDNHGGEVSLCDAPGGGALFRVTLPSLPPEDEVEPDEVAGSGLILVVDDETALREATQRVLETLGYDVLTAANGRDALAVFHQRHQEIAAVLLDMKMPQLDGRQTYLGLREIAPDVRVLLTTGYRLDEEAQALLDLGVRGFIQKPWSFERLSSSMSQLLR